jgi:hypothetical protein
MVRTCWSVHTGSALLQGTATERHVASCALMQAQQELPGEWQLMRGGSPGVPDPTEWLAHNLPPGAKVGIDPFVHTISSARKLQQVRHADSGDCR